MYIESISNSILQHLADVRLLLLWTSHPIPHKLLESVYDIIHCQIKSRVDFKPNLCKRKQLINTSNFYWPCTCSACLYWFSLQLFYTYFIFVHALILYDSIARVFIRPMSVLQSPRYYASQYVITFDTLFIHKTLGCIEYLWIYILVKVFRFLIDLHFYRINVLSGLKPG